MLKRGLFHPEAAAIYDGTNFLEDRVAFSLLRTGVPPSLQEVARFESIMRCLRLSDGTYRSTAARRFEALDNLFQPLVQSRFPANHPLKVEDWAASACITSAEWFTRLSQGFPHVELIASDLHLHLIEVLLPDGGSFVVEEEGQPLQYLKRPFVIPLHRKEGIHVPVNRWMQRRAQARFERLRLAGTFNFSALEEKPDHWEQGSLRFRKISLIHPSALALRATCKRFQIESHSVFAAKTIGNCDVIRTMNILNRGYFEEKRLAEGIRAVWLSLRDGGLWIIGRTAEESPGKPQHASVLERGPSGFRVVARADSASEIETLAVGFQD